MQAEKGHADADRNAGDTGQFFQLQETDVDASVSFTGSK